jgi:hypothetical protein
MAVCYYSPIGNAQQFFTNQGVVLSGGSLTTYLAGSVTPQVTYTDATGVTPNNNPMVLNSAGYVQSPIWIPINTAIKFVLKDSLSNTIWTWDNVSGINDTSSIVLNEWQSTGLTPSYIDANHFTVTGNQTAVYSVYRRVKVTVTAGIRYATITTSVFGAGVTTVTLLFDSGSLDNGLSSALISFQNPNDPSVPGYINYLMNLNQTQFRDSSNNPTWLMNSTGQWYSNGNSQPAASISTSASKNSAPGTFTTYSTTDWNQGGMTVSASNGTIQVPVAGKYLITWSGTLTLSGGIGLALYETRKNASISGIPIYYMYGSGGSTSGGLSYLLALAANDTLDMYLASIAGTGASAIVQQFGATLLL